MEQFKWVRRPYDVEREKEEADFDAAVAATLFIVRSTGEEPLAAFRVKRASDPITLSNRIKKLFVDCYQIKTGKHLMEHEHPTVRWMRRWDKDHDKWVLDYFVRFRGTEKRVFEVVM